MPAGPEGPGRRARPRVEYRHARASRGVDSYELSGEPARPGDEVLMVSGAFASAQRCRVSGVVFRLKEDAAVSEDAYRLTCRGRPGTSGSPLISAETGRIVGVDNTGSGSTGS